MVESRAMSRGHLVVVIAGVGLLLMGRAPAWGAEGAVGSVSHAPTSLADRLRLDKPLGRDSRLVCDLRELLRYTPVGGLQPGALCEWERGTHSETKRTFVDAGLNLGTLGDADGLVGIRWRLASVSLAEIGVQAHAITDTSDQWRTDRLQSSLSFALQNRPDSDYFRRTGIVAFATVQPSPRTLLGMEYRLDDYASEASRDQAWILPSDLEVVWRNPAITAGRMGSLVLRAEWSSRAVASSEVGSAWRHTEESLVSGRLSSGSERRVAYRSLATLEVARRALGSDQRLAFTRLIMDDRLEMVSGPLRGLRLRARLGAVSGDGPAQKGEGLGGWSAVRGYAFNRYRGDVSLLGSVQLRRGPMAVFLDAGAVHEPAGWSGLLAGAGTEVFLWRALRVGMAWRLTGAGREAVPSARLLLTEGW
jgi:hypothetical protein